jgi:hypothetical protein
MWLEQANESTDAEIWRGRISHIPGDEHQYFTNRKAISKFIRIYLKEKK